MSTYKNPQLSILENNEEAMEEKHNQRESVGNGYENCIEECYFAFVDVLGFKRDFLEEGERICGERPNKYDEVFKYYFELMEKAVFSQYNDFYAGQTSDSLYFYTSNTQCLVDYIRIFQHFNNYAMSKKVFFRGGIAKGILYYNQRHQFYGDSVIKAYLLESVVAVYPRIIIDKKTYDTLKDLYKEEFTSIIKG